MPDLSDYVPGVREGLVTIANNGLSSVVVDRLPRTAYLRHTTGSEDDTVIQAAINLLSSGGRIVLAGHTTYSTRSTIKMINNVVLEGEDRNSTVIQMAAGRNQSVISNLNTSTGNSGFEIRNLTIDQNGNNQTTGGGGGSFTGISDVLIENVYFATSYSFNLFIGSMTGTALTGTATFTNADSTVTGSGTSFTTQLAVGDIIKSAGGHFQRVRSITSNTSLELDRAWGWSTEEGVAARRVPANARNHLINCTFNGTIDIKDNVGLGIFDDSLVQGCISRNSTGYGFGPDHANRVRFIGNTCYDNDNAGIGMETCGYCVVQGNEFFRNGVGVYLLSGAYRNTIANNICAHNTNGIAVSYNTTSFPQADENDLTNNICEGNATGGINVDGVARTAITGNRCANNGSFGIRIQTGSSVVPAKTQIIGNRCYDNQDTKTQARGIYVLNGTDTLVANNMSITADHVTAGITDSGTTTTLADNVTS